MRLLILWPALLGRHNFVNFGRHGAYMEFAYRKHFAKYIDWLMFNLEWVDRYAGPKRITALVPPLSSKSGKHTAGEFEDVALRFDNVTPYARNTLNSEH